MNTTELVRFAKLDTNFSGINGSHGILTLLQGPGMSHYEGRPFGKGQRDPLVSVVSARYIGKSVSRVKRKVNYANELQTVAKFSQPEYEEYFVRSYGWYETKDAVLIAMEFVELGDLQGYLRVPFCERETQQIVLQVLRDLTCMHAAGYAHRDLKPANLLVFSMGPRWHIKIADFGLSKRVLTDTTALRTNAGTYGFMAPEMLGLVTGNDDSSDDDTQQPYTNAVDIWAVGVISYLLLTGEMPFSPSEPRALGRYARGKTVFPTQALVANNVGQQAQIMVKSLMASRPSERPTSEVSTKHGWLSTNIPSINSRILEDLPSAQWTTVPQDSGSCGQRTTPVDTQPHTQDNAEQADWIEGEGATMNLSPTVLSRPCTTGPESAAPEPAPEQPPGQSETKTMVKATPAKPVMLHKVMHWNNWLQVFSFAKKQGWSDSSNVAFTHDGRLMACVSETNVLVCFYDTTNKVPKLTSQVDAFSPSSLAFSYNGQRLAFVSRNAVYLWNSTEPTKSIRVPSIDLGSESGSLNDDETRVALSPNGQMLVYRTAQDVLKLRDLGQKSNDRILEQSDRQAL
ncbi:Serine/threonine-protein kinase H1 [Elasticomyces elasticus]|nr:Serine/threonine-protein kinase H1 [Elasticomyces elasticus]